jgi:NitT/TauT family transport system substrate-binding protein
LLGSTVGHRLLSISVLTLAVAAATVAAATASPTTRAGTSPTPVSFSLDFLVDGLHAPFYSAEQLGYFKQSGLDVAIHTSTGSSDAIARVASGKAQIGLADAPTALLAISKGLPIKIVGVLLLHSAQATETMRSSGVSTVKGLEGKTIGITPAGAERQFIGALFKVNHVDESSVHFVSIQANSGKADLLSGKVEAVNFFPAIFADVKDKVNFIPWFKYGLDVYGTTIIANTNFIDENPQAVTAFVHSAMRGLRYTLRNPNGAAEIVAKAAKGKVPFFRAELGVYKPYWSDPPLQKKGLGYMTPERWNVTQQAAVKYLNLPKPIPLGTLYTNAFLGAPVQS